MRKFKKQWAETLNWTELVHLVELYAKEDMLQSQEDEYQRESKDGSYACSACHYIYLRATEIDFSDRKSDKKEKPVDGLVISRLQNY